MQYSIVFDQLSRRKRFLRDWKVSPAVISTNKRAFYYHFISVSVQIRQIIAHLLR